MDNDRWSYICVVTQRIEWTNVSTKHDIYRNTKEIMGAHTRFWTRRSVYWSIVMVPSESCFFSASLPDCSHCSLMVVEGGGLYSLFEVYDEDCGCTPVFPLYIDWYSLFRRLTMTCKCVRQHRKYMLEVFFLYVDTVYIHTMTAEKIHLILQITATLWKGVLFLDDAFDTSSPPSQKNFKKRYLLVTRWKPAAVFASPMEELLRVLFCCFTYSDEVENERWCNHAS